MAFANIQLPGNVPMILLGSRHFAQMANFWRTVFQGDKNQVKSRAVIHKGAFSGKLATNCMSILWWRVKWISDFMTRNYVN